MPPAKVCACTVAVPDPNTTVNLGGGGNLFGLSANQGSMVLFKLNTSVYSNRPLELEITPEGGGEPSSVVLDL